MEKKNPNIYQRALDIVNNRINPDIPQGGGGQGWTDEQIDLLEAVFEKIVYTDAQGGVIANQLIASLRGGIIPEEPITITFDGTTAQISGLNSLNTTFSGATAIIGG